MTSQHRYGPHRPEDAPNAVTVLGPGTTQGGRPYPSPQVRPIPASLLAQRERINSIAAEESNHRLRDAAELARELAAGDALAAYPCTCGVWHFGTDECPDGGEPVTRDD